MKGEIMQSRRRMKINECPWNMTISQMPCGKMRNPGDFRGNSLHNLGLESKGIVTRTIFDASKGSLKIQENLLKSHWILRIAQVNNVEKTMWKLRKFDKIIQTPLFKPEKLQIDLILYDNCFDCTLSAIECLQTALISEKMKIHIVERRNFQNVLTAQLDNFSWIFHFHIVLCRLERDKIL